MKLNVACLSSVLFSTVCFADAGANINFANNCNKTIEFSVSGDASGNYTVPPNQYTNQFVVLGKMSTKSTANYNIAATTGGSINLKLSDGWTENSMTFSNVNNLGTNLLASTTQFNWHGAPIPGSFVGTPTFTITSCPYQSIDISKSALLNNVKRVLIFGDSLSDDGNLVRADGGVLPKSTPYYNGQFSNGNTWAMLFKQTLTPIGVSVSNYAVGGAVSVFHLQEKLPYSLGGEYNIYTKDTHSFSEPPEQRLAIILIGANDYLGLAGNSSTADLDKKTDDVINNGISPAVTSLLNGGIKKIILIDLPDMGATPECAQDNDCAVLTSVANMHNTKLTNLIANLSSQYSDSTIQKISIASLFNLAINNTNEFNQRFQTSLSNINSPCWTGGYTVTPQRPVNLPTNFTAMFGGTSYPLPNTKDIQEAYRVGSTGNACSSPWEYLFWDHVHPTRQVHQAFFQYFVQQLGASLNK